MKKPYKCLAVFRETTNSPNRENDDALILKAVTEELVKLNVYTSLIEPESLPFIDPADWDAVLPMCENPPALKTIGGWKKGPLVLNPISAVLNCYRVNMTPLMVNCGDVHPRTELRPLTGIPGKPPAFWNGQGAWLKRGDVHNTCNHDVVYVGSWEESAAVKADFLTRNITSAVIQEHIPGDLIKFYGVGPMKWFHWFYHKPEAACNYKFDGKDLERSAAVIARAVGLEIYGGDAIVTPQGRIYVIDINSWPSFSRVRHDIKRHIASHVHERILKSRAKSGDKEKI
ncbi:MAG: hypothetical protein GX410_00030 [Elusimicrobia bacterium]|nr:hypothetical protein [Elusimicrobiota bacterium]